MTDILMKRHEDGRTKQAIESRPWDRCSIGAAAGLAGGLGVGLSGMALTVVSWFAGEALYARTLGTLLLFMMIPLLVFGAHCLDLSEKRKDAERKARFVEDD